MALATFTSHLLRSVGCTQRLFRLPPSLRRPFRRRRSRRRREAHIYISESDGCPFSAGGEGGPKGRSASLSFSFFPPLLAPEKRKETKSTSSRAAEAAAVKGDVVVVVATPNSQYPSLPPTTFFWIWRLHHPPSSFIRLPSQKTLFDAIPRRGGRRRGGGAAFVGVGRVRSGLSWQHLGQSKQDTTKRSQAGIVITGISTREFPAARWRRTVALSVVADTSSSPLPPSSSPCKEGSCNTTSPKRPQRLPHLSPFPPPKPTKEEANQKNFQEPSTVAGAVPRAAVSPLTNPNPKRGRREGGEGDEGSILSVHICVLQALFPPLPLPHPPYGYAPFFPGRRIGAAASPLSSRQPRPNQQESPPPPEQLPNFHSSPLLLSLTSFFSPLVRFVISSVPSAFEGRWERGGVGRQCPPPAARPRTKEHAAAAALPKSLLRSNERPQASHRRRRRRRPLAVRGTAAAAARFRSAAGAS